MVSKSISLSFGLLFITLMINAEIDDDCLACICKVESGCSPKDCAWDDCGTPDDSFETCATYKDCSEECVRAYMDRYGKRCTKNREPTCEDYARIHNGGPIGCRRSSTDGYWNKVSACYSKSFKKE
ncbi:unnamed protein product [Rotaria sp. Silwood1]|nr:unnamed protein product [Rotaria sp. Silwood1]CAF1008437.1 unnamed protein product [Rotaria sp. Silwood1]CAF3398368.1 unnamed protein product [Rotaria sp. Silwood1]CAF3422641.1 unnamed protein product [Rotaria sp. Silwood1]CAF3424817.1 unnamed protein product [Rotaria sp. Silwood1]